MRMKTLSWFTALLFLCAALYLQAHPQEEITDARSGERSPRELRLVRTLSQSAPGTEETQAVKEEEVTLFVSVVDKNKHTVTGLDAGNFTVLEDGKPQQITSFQSGNVPASIGILVDNSGSMRDKRAKMVGALMEWVNTRDPQDEVFVVNFNDDAYLDQDFTRDSRGIREALDRTDSRGGTALYDAVTFSSEHMTKLAKHEKRILLVVTDGEDNVSKRTLEQCLRAFQDAHSPAILAIALFGGPVIGRHERRALQALESLSSETGGAVFLPKRLSQLSSVIQEVADKIRSQYCIRYTPSNPIVNGGYRRLKITAQNAGRKDIEVHFRAGYLAGTTATSQTATH